MTGRLIAVVGPSGVGKDSVIAGLAAARPELHVVRRVITRPAGAGGEEFEPVTEAEFERRRVAGAFALHWRAHGHAYAIPADVDDALAAGRDVLANLSRRVLPRAAARFDRLRVLALTADPARLAERLAGRGRESAAEIAARMAREAPPRDLPADVPVIRLANDGPLEATVAAALAALYPDSGTRAR